jgi:diguanylate cyclase (GGDEF)-like protein
MWILTLRSSTNEPLVYALKAGKNTLGRGPDNDIVIVDDSVSRQHAEIDCQADRLVLRDLGSKNGTFVNQARISRAHLLKSGDQIHIGQRLVRLFQRNTNSLAAPSDDLSETKPRIRELPLEPVEPYAALLYAVANRLILVPDLEGGLREISELIRIAMQAERCGVVLSADFDRLEELGFPETIARQAIEKRSVVLAPDISSRSKKSLSKSARLLYIRTALCIPVLIEAEVAGVIYLFKTDPAAALYAQDDASLLVAVSHQVALAIQRARLLEKAKVLEKWAVTDSLTGLCNRRQILNLAELEFQRAQSLKSPLSLLMLDIDLFKQVNDTHGHPIGDHVLKAAAMRFKGQLRGIDTVGRYGGDEFMILLVDSGLEAARTIAERLRQSIAGAPFETERGLVSVTVSIGIAALSEDCPDLEALIGQADGALYAAKRGGRNRVKAAA